MEVTQEYDARDLGAHTAAWSTAQQPCASGTAGGAWSCQPQQQQAQAAREASICSSAMLPPPPQPQRQLNPTGTSMPQPIPTLQQRDPAQQQAPQQPLQPLLTLQQLQQQQEQYMRPLLQSRQQQQAQRQPPALQRLPQAQRAQQGALQMLPNGFHVEKLAHVLLRNPGFAGQLADTMAAWIMENGWAESPLSPHASSAGPAAAAAAAAIPAFDSGLETPFAGVAFQPFDAPGGASWAGTRAGHAGCLPRPACPGFNREVSGCSNAVPPPAKRLRTSSSAGNLPELLAQQQQQQAPSKDTQAPAHAPGAPATGHAPTSSLPGTPRSRAVPRLPSGLQGSNKGPVPAEPPPSQVAKILAAAAGTAGAGGGGGAGGGAPLPHGWRPVQQPLPLPQQRQPQQLAQGCPGFSGAPAVARCPALGGGDVQACIELLKAYAQAKQEQRRSKAAQLVVQGLLGPLPHGRT